MRPRVRDAVAAAVMLIMAATAARAQPPASTPGSLLDVPFIQQSELLCGGAAAAMVMRYWGATGVYAETFAPLVNPAAGGIRGAALLEALRARGWDARSFQGDRDLVGARLRDRQPVVALLEDRPGAFHYVVIVAWASGRVVLHDPARAPFRVMTERAFSAAWEKSGRWTMLVLPGDALTRPTAKDAPVTAATAATPSACDALVDEGVAAAGRGELAAAIETFEAAATACPRDSGPWREMAGVFAVREDWPRAAQYASKAVQRNRRDRHAWQILATSRFVTGDSAGALDAWNHAGEPTIDIVTVHGLERTRSGAATALMGLRARALLTPGMLQSAERRLDELPAAQSARVTYRPLEQGRASVDAVLIERPRTPASWTAIAVLGAHAASDREVSASVTNPTGAGDRLTASWRFWQHRPRIAAAYAAPMPVGVVRGEIFSDTQTYSSSTGASLVKEVRRGGSVALSNWTTRSLRWEVAVGFDAWTTRAKSVSIGGSMDRRLFDDRVSLKGTATTLVGSFSAWTAGGAVEWRSSRRHDGSVLLARGALELVSSTAPFALWPGAGTGHARSALLRAHPLLDDGIVAGNTFGRRLSHAGAEWRRWFKPGLRLVPIAPAVFIDVAHAAKRLRPGDAWQADAGAGLRVAILGSGVLRLDVATGLRDRRTVASVGWIR